MRAALLCLLFAPSLAVAHGGGLNADGCHTNRKTGDYHCHGSPAPRSSAPARTYFATPPAAPTPRSYGGGVAPRVPVTPLREGYGGTGQVVYANCAAARAAGAAPVRRGRPGYGPHLDRDGDGVGCE